MESLFERLQNGLHAGCGWLLRHIADDGSIARSDRASLYYKVPASLAVNGELGAALRVLDWVGARLLQEGRLSIPADQESARMNSYDRGWLVWGASLCGRYDLAFPLAEDLLQQQDRATGGFWDNQASRAAASGRQHAMTAGMAGLGLLSTRHIAEACRVGEFLLHSLELQDDLEAGLQLAIERGADGSQRPSPSRSGIDYLDRRQVKQRPARLGPVIVLLVRLHRLTRQIRFLNGARQYVEAVLTGCDGIDQCVEAHKFMWGLVELDQAASNERCRKAALRIADYLLQHQQPEGDWRGDAVGGKDADQPLDLRLNTTCNALVGLAYCRYLERISPTAR
jgi:hypothetical protein